MPKTSDASPAATQIRLEQAHRLRRLRELVEPYQGEAAAQAGVSKYSWNRQEQGVSDINAVALARFSAAYRLPAEYVVTGSLVGMPDGLVRRLIEAENAERHPAPEGIAAPSAPQPGRIRSVPSGRTGRAKERI